MNKTTKTAVLVIDTDTTINEDILNVIRTNHGTNTRIKTVRSAKAFATPYGFTNLVQQYTTGRNTTVYALKTDLKGPALKAAMQTGIKFNLLFRNRSRNWNSVSARQITASSPRPKYS